MQSACCRKRLEAAKKDFILAQTEVKDSDIPPEPEDGFERLMAKLEAEVGTSPESEKESSSENIVKLHEEARKPRRLIR